MCFKNRIIEIGQFKMIYQHFKFRAVNGMFNQFRAVKTRFLPRTSLFLSAGDVGGEINGQKKQPCCLT